MSHETSKLERVLSPRVDPVADRETTAQLDGVVSHILLFVCQFLSNGPSIVYHIYFTADGGSSSLFLATPLSSDVAQVLASPNGQDSLRNAYQQVGLCTDLRRKSNLNAYDSGE